MRNKFKRVLAFIASTAVMGNSLIASMPLAVYGADAGGIVGDDTSCTCMDKCAEGSVNSECAVCVADLTACIGTEAADLGADNWCVVDTEAGTVTIDGTLGGKTTATEDDITALLDAIKGYVDGGITTIIVTGSEPATIELYGLTRTAICEAIYRLTDSGYYDENNPYNGKIDLILPDVTEIVDQEFYGAFALNSITLPKVTTVGNGAFVDCFYLRKITFGSVITSINQSNTVVFHRIAEKIDGCDLVLNCGQLQAEDTYKPDLENNVWFKPSWGGDEAWKSITLTHTLDENGVCTICGIVSIDDITFPDETFRNYVDTNFDTTDDDMLDADEIAEVTKIDLYSANITDVSDLTGVEYFTALEYLDCYENKLTSLDVSKNTALVFLDCSCNQLTSLDMSGCTSLNTLYCHSNQLTNLNVSENTALTNLDCSCNQLTSLDVSGCTSLTNLDCHENQLTSLDVNGCTSLTYLYCYENQLTSLDVNGCTALEYLNCESPPALETRPSGVLQWYVAL